MAIVHTDILVNPLNWITVFLMVVLYLFVVDAIVHRMTVVNASSNQGN